MILDAQWQSCKLIKMVHRHICYSFYSRSSVTFICNFWIRFLELSPQRFVLFITIIKTIIILNQLLIAMLISSCCTNVVWELELTYIYIYMPVSKSFYDCLIEWRLYQKINLYFRHCVELHFERKTIQRVHIIFKRIINSVSCRC